MAAQKYGSIKPFILGIETIESWREAQHQEIEKRTEERDERLNHRYKSSKVRFLYSFEEAYDTYLYYDDFFIMYKMLQATVKNKALAYGRRWSKKRLSHDDFESVFWEEAWKVCEDYTTGDKYLLYETIVLALGRKAVDVIRKATKTKQGRFENSALPLSVDFESFYPDSTNIEEEITNNIIVEQVLNDEALTTVEKQFLRALYANPDASYRQLAIEIGFEYHEQARRLLERIRTKLKKYNCGIDWYFVI